MASTVMQLLMEEDEFFLPHEIMLNILKRLPIKSLLRFRCVCKDWNDMFNTSLFINTPMPLNPPLVYHPFCMVRIIGFSFGLVCFQLKIDGSLFLWNPATREVQYVPKTNDNDLCHIGFGFSRVVNDYKILRIYIYLKRVEVYSLSTGSWKEVEFGNLFEGVSFISGISGKFAATDEAIYWFAYNHINILSFETATEVLTLIPNLVASHVHWTIKLIAYENKLALLSGIEYWVMEEATSGGYGQRWNKTKLGSPCLHNSNPMTIWRNEAVFELAQRPPNTEFGLYCFNLTTNKLKEFLIAHEYGNVRSAFNDVEILVSLVTKIQEHHLES